MTIAYVFSPTCTWCKQDYNNLVTLQASVKDRYAFIGITTTSTEDALGSYLKTRPFPGKVLVVDVKNLPSEIESELDGTPQLLVIDKGGLIRKAWPGALFDDRKQAVETFFGVQLPGLAPEPKPAVAPAAK
jgi:hypothetical protein